MTRTKFKMKHKNLKTYTIRLRIQRETTEEETSKEKRRCGLGVSQAQGTMESRTAKGQSPRGKGAKHGTGVINKEYPEMGRVIQDVPSNKL